MYRPIKLSPMPKGGRTENMGRNMVQRNPYHSRMNDTGRSG